MGSNSGSDERADTISNRDHTRTFHHADISSDRGANNVTYWSADNWLTLFDLLQHFLPQQVRSRQAWLRQVMRLSSTACIFERCQLDEMRDRFYYCGQG